MAVDRITFGGSKKENTTKAAESTKPLPPPPNKYLLRTFKLAFPFFVVGNVILAGYVMAKAKQRDQHRKGPTHSESPEILQDPAKWYN